MKNFLLIPNRQKDVGLVLTRSIRDALRWRGAICHIYDEYHVNDTSPIKVPKNTECILVIGGDGTILAAAGRLVGKNIPLLGINLGTMGFLADVDLNDLPEMIQSLVDDKYELERRIMLRAEICRAGQCLYTFTALNDFVINRSGFSKVIGLAVRINGTLIEQYRADGVIICTPTGSTGYNLSAGGPIINPTCKNFVLTPICPHSLAMRSVVLAKEDIVTIEMENVRPDQKEEAMVSPDGKDGMMIRPGDQVKVYKAEEVTPFIKMKEVSFVKILKEKLL
ncbi:MAG: NAD(+)/NADH kinase [Clostridiales bacterium]|nr:NAD(+)/NADH kinase [Clostridiales bacterium]